MLRRDDPTWVHVKQLIQDLWIIGAFAGLVGLFLFGVYTSDHSRPSLKVSAVCVVSLPLLVAILIASDAIGFALKNIRGNRRKLPDSTKQSCEL